MYKYVGYHTRFDAAVGVAGGLHDCIMLLVGTELVYPWQWQHGLGLVLIVVKLPGWSLEIREEVSC